MPLWSLFIIIENIHKISLKSGQNMLQDSNITTWKHGIGMGSMAVG